MTWAEFKQKVEELGVLDHDTLAYIDVAFDLGDPEIKAKCENDVDKPAAWRIW